MAGRGRLAHSLFQVSELHMIAGNPGQASG